MQTIDGVYQFTLGAFSCTVIQDGVERLPPEQIEDVGFVNAAKEEMAAEVRRYVAATGDPADTVSFNVLLVDTGARRVLVDTGLGAEGGRLLERLAAAGVARESIDVVVITHGHGDHIGANATADGSATFPNARYVMSEVEWQRWTAEPGDSARAQLLPLAERVERITTDAEILPGIRAVPAPGHTPGQIALLIESQGERLLHLADVFHHPVECPRPEWYFSFDDDAARTVETRRALLERAAREELLVMTYHLAFPGLGHVVADGDAWHWRPLAAG